MTQDNMLEVMHSGRLADLGKACLSMPQINMELSHLFTDKAYARKLIMPADSVVMSCVHKTEHITVCCYGVSDVVDNDGNKTRVTAGMFWITPAGTERALHIIEESCWITFHVGKFDSVEDAEQKLVDVPDYFNDFYQIEGTA
jgi:hypothetical protein